ncbi:hypothetical protein [Desulfovibrio ferrophilus]|uniref:Uncharacterized protein n=1 Tax=Desulfovibrio ferrophilus TaxID=241368 RepID=A0A2Z6AUD8_9BACT|nr:hypothetical protein [Desulfovibrio ferrophilus]BBD06847.1 uncharacterized protein DFE_0121 [Desulfovibrio ferrophilus]
MSDSHTALAGIVSRLDDIAVQIRTLEAEAEILLHEQNDPAASEYNMRRKTELLSELPEVVESLTDDLDEEMRNAVEDGVDGFAQRAMMALGQGSVFWMRNLLYPDDYEQGQPNDLERFIAGLAGR